MTPRCFPFDVFRRRDFPEPIGPLLERIRTISMFPPYPWGQWTYARVFDRHCATLPGDVIEAGVGMGGMSLFFGVLLEQRLDPRRVFSVDTFDGLPAPGDQDNPYFREGLYAPATALADPLSRLLAGSATPGLDAFQMRASELGVADRVTAIAGLFSETLPELDPDQTFSFVHIDGDLFESVHSALEHLWDKVDAGGVVAIDDFFHPGQGPHRAAAEFFGHRDATPVYHVVFPYSVFVVKEPWGDPRRAVDGNAYSLEWLRNDPLFVETLMESRRASRRDRRARANCQLLLDALEGDDDCRGIYDYWLALEQFWATIDIRPDGWAND